MRKLLIGLMVLALGGSVSATEYYKHGDWYTQETWDSVTWERTSHDAADSSTGTFTIDTVTGYQRIKRDSVQIDETKWNRFLYRWWQSGAAVASSESQYFPYATVSGTVDANIVSITDGVIAVADFADNVPADVVEISGDATAANNLELALDGTGGVAIDADIRGNIWASTDVNLLRNGGFERDSVSPGSAPTGWTQISGGAYGTSIMYSSGAISGIYSYKLDVAGPTVEDSLGMYQVLYDLPAGTYEIGGRMRFASGSANTNDSVFIFIDSGSSPPLVTGNWDGFVARNGTTYELFSFTHTLTGGTWSVGIASMTDGGFDGYFDDIYMRRVSPFANDYVTDSVDGLVAQLDAIADSVDAKVSTAGSTANLPDSVTARIDTIKALLYDTVFSHNTSWTLAEHLTDLFGGDSVEVRIQSSDTIYSIIIGANANTIDDTAVGMIDVNLAEISDDAGAASNLEKLVDGTGSSFSITNLNIASSAGPPVKITAPADTDAVYIDASAGSRGDAINLAADDYGVTSDKEWNVNIHSVDTIPSQTATISATDKAEIATAVKDTASVYSGVFYGPTGAGSGSDTVVIYAVDTTDNDDHQALQGVKITVMNAAGQETGPVTTGTNGAATVYLDPDPLNNYTLIAVQPPYTFVSTSLTVTGNIDSTEVRGTNTQYDGLCYVYGVIEDIRGNAVQYGLLRFELPDNVYNSCDSSSLIPRYTETRTSSDGSFGLYLTQSACVDSNYYVVTVSHKRHGTEKDKIFVPEQSSYEWWIGK